MRRLAAPGPTALLTRGAAALLTGVCAAVLTGCSTSGGQPPAATAAAPAAAAPAGASYVVKDYSFPPLTASPGQVIRVVDGDGEPHTLTARDGSFDTGSFDASRPGRFTAPRTPGSYPFSCRIHPSMTGTLVVR